MSTRRSVRAGVAALAFALAACSTTTELRSGTEPPATFDTAPPASTTAPSTTSTTSPATTVPATSTSAAPVSAGWRSIDAADVPGLAFPPCCASNWVGSPSPALPAPGVPLADGLYAAVTVWPDVPTGPLVLTLHRFEQCAALPEFACDEEPDGFSPDSLGIDESSQYGLVLPLDATVRVVLVGFTGWESALTTIAEGNGADIAELAAALDAAYEEAITAPFDAGVPPETIIADLYASPVAGFGPVPGFDPEMMAAGFTYDGAPPLLMQAVFDDTSGDPMPSRGTSVLFIPSVEVRAGIVTVYVYAGYYP